MPLLAAVSRIAVNLAGVTALRPSWAAVWVSPSSSSVISMAYAE